ncbi:MAG: hypothetical protein RBS39_13550, partial [Phycisphaerales bacterium]|nr:hypothetical protein [Phycisphaerales bacterium]
MSELFSRLFSLRSLDPSDPRVEWALTRPVPPWAWLILAMGAVIVAGASYYRLTGSRGARAALAMVRAILLVLLVLLACGPRLERPDVRTEKDRFVVLIDRSASLRVDDAPDDADREAQLRAALRAAWPAFQQIGTQKDVAFLGFDAGVFDLDVARDPTDPDRMLGLELGEPDGRRTDLDAALSQALARSLAHPLSGVLVISDGRSAAPMGNRLIESLQSERAPVFAVALGSEHAPPDVAIARVDAPSLAFVDDAVPVGVRLARSGDGDPGPARVELVDDATGLVLDSVDVSPDEDSVTLSSREGTPGERKWSVRVVPEGGDLVESNNVERVDLRLVDRPLRVAYFDGYPRWEQRYLKNLLLRERSINSSNLLLSSSRRYLQEGDTTLDALPRSPEEWAPLDVVVIGDVRADTFGDLQLEQLREHVAQRGAGLLWIAGPGATPSSWVTSPLADLLPFRASGDLVPAWDRPVVMQRTPLAERLALLQLGDSARQPWPRAVSDPASGWSMLRWAQRIDPESLKPTAEVLAEFAAVDGTGPRTPAVLSMRYGAGRIVYVATDEVWRWRYARGETLPERFWLPIVRALGRTSLARGGRSATLEGNPTRGEVGQLVRVRSELLDQSLVDARPASHEARIVRLASDGSRSDVSPTSVRLAPEDAGADPITRGG